MPYRLAGFRDPKAKHKSKIGVLRTLSLWTKKTAALNKAGLSNQTKCVGLVQGQAGFGSCKAYCQTVVLQKLPDADDRATKRHLHTSVLISFYESARLGWQR